MANVTVHAPTLMETKAIAQKLAPLLAPGDCLLLDGALGAGKSAFSRFLIQHLANSEIEVPSPTYTVLQTYALPRFSIYHYDLYRITEPDELYELEWQDARFSGVCLVEWPTRLEHLKPPGALTISISIDSEHARRFHFSGDEPKWERHIKSIG